MPLIESVENGDGEKAICANSDRVYVTALYTQFFQTRLHVQRPNQLPLLLMIIGSIYSHCWFLSYKLTTVRRLFTGCVFSS